MKIICFNPHRTLKTTVVQTRPEFLSAKNNENFSPLKKDTVSFNGRSKKVKKSAFSGIDFSVIEKYRIDISNFTSKEDLQKRAKEKIAELGKKDFGGRSEESIIQRKEMFNEWFDYVTNDNNAYTPVMQLEILTAITKDLKPNTDNIPPVLNKGVLADTMSEVLDRLNQNRKENVNINKIYQTKLNAFYYGIDEKGIPQSDFTGWIVIPSKEHDSEHFEENVDKLKTLSHKSWCTKSFNAEPYLSEGDFHVYLENGQPKLGVRFKEDKIAEIQGEQNNGIIPPKYYPEVKQYIKEKYFLLSWNAEKEMFKARNFQRHRREFTEQVGEKVINDCDAEIILPYFEINVKKDTDGKLIISKFDQPSDEYTFDDLGIDEDKLLKNVKKIEDLCNLKKSKVTNLESLEEVGGSVRCSNQNGINLKNLKKIGGSARFSSSENINLDNLEYIGKIANFTESDIDLPKLEYIGDNAHFKKSKIKKLDSLVTCNGTLDISESEIVELKKLENVDGTLWLNDKITSLEKLRYVSGGIRFDKNNKIVSLPDLDKNS